MNILFIIILLAEPISISVKSGTIVDTKDQKIEIKAGTFIPDPHDKILAKKIVEKNSKIKMLETNIDTLEKRVDLNVLHFETKEKENLKHWNSRWKVSQTEIAYLKSPWHRWGKTVMWCMISAVGAAGLTYLVMEVKN